MCTHNKVEPLYIQSYMCIMMSILVYNKYLIFLYVGILQSYTFVPLKT